MMGPPSADEGRVYYPALDGLRFVAIALVYLFHRGVPQLAPAINDLARVFGWRLATGGGPAIRPGDAIVANGWIGVQIFFLLSGFLITTLLLREEARTGRVDLRAFWMRRILRIWPLYYLTLSLVFFALPFLAGATGREVRALWAGHLAPFLLFAGNWSMALVGPVPYDAISILWSVCVEEQFYLLAPFLVAAVRPRWRVPVVVVGIASAILGRGITALALERGAVTPLFFQFSTVTHLDTLLAGVLLALVKQRTRWRPSDGALRLAEVVALVSGLGLLAWPDLARGSALNRPFGYVAIWASAVVWVALAASGRGLLHVLLSYERFVWMGRISYGLYMFHEIAFWLQRRLFEEIGWFPNRDVLSPFAAFGLTLGLASASYYGFERPFLKRKVRWSRVRSRPV